MLFKITLLQRYLFSEILRIFVAVLGALTILLLFVGVFQMATERGLGPDQALQVLPYVVPSLLPFTVPAALLLTVSMVYGRIAGDQELTAAKAAGIHPVSLMWPALFLGGVLSVGSLVLTDQVIPWSVSRIEEHVVSVMEDIFLDRLRTEHQFSDPRSNLLITVSGVEGKRLIRPTIRYKRQDRLFMLQAEEAQIDLDMSRQQALVRLKNYWVDIPGKAKGYNLSERVEAISWDGGSDRLDQKPRNLPIIRIENELEQISRDRRHETMKSIIEAAFALTQADFPRVAQTAADRDSGIRTQTARINKLHTEIHSRYALACSCFFFVLVGTPFSMRYGKSQYLTSFLLCFLPIVCGYYPLMLGLMAQAKKGTIGPEWSMWVGNVLLAIVAAFVCRRVIRY